MREVAIPDGEAAGLTLPTLIEQLQAIQAASQRLNPSQVLTPFVSVLRPGAIGHSPAVPITAVHAGFDWDAGRVLFSCEFALTKLTKEDVAAIRQSVSAGSSWHAYQAQKHLRDRIAELEQEVTRLKLICTDPKK